MSYFPLTPDKKQEEATQTPAITIKRLAPVHSQKIEQSLHSTGERPSHLDPRHWQDWLDSGVNPIIIALNIRSIQGESTNLNGDFELPIAELLNTPITRGRWINREGFKDEGQPNRQDWVRKAVGWVVGGLDPLNNWESMLWKCFKADTPWNDFDGVKKKPRKYEHPANTPTRAFFLRVPFHVWEKVAKRHDLPMPQNITIAQTGEAIGFWAWILENKIPITLCEGAKKSGALLTQGIVAIALPGIFSGYRKENDLSGRNYHYLIPELQPFADGRNIFICFDNDEKVQARKNVAIASARLGSLFEEFSSNVRVVRFAGEKGIDDWIVAQLEGEVKENSEKTFEDHFISLWEDAHDLLFYQIIGKAESALSRSVDLLLNQRYLGKLPLPHTGLTFLKSLKGTGKTTSLEEAVDEAIKTGRPVLLITHRIQLGKYICDKLGLYWLTEDVDPAGERHLGLCADSLWRVNPENFKNAIIIVDEIEQVIWHTLGGSTCYSRRTQILKNFTDLIRTICSTAGLFIGLDADLSDRTIDYIAELANQRIRPWVCVNEWKPEKEQAKAKFYFFKNPARLIRTIEKCLERGERLYITTDSKSGTFSSYGLEKEIREKFPTLKVICVNATTSQDSNHPAHNFVERINSVITQYDVVICSPSIGSGVSIDVKGHFHKVFGIFNGVIPDWEARQGLARVRDPIERHIWCATLGMGWVRKTIRSTNYKDIVKIVMERTEHTAVLAELIAPNADVEAILEGNINPAHLKCWARMAAEVNYSMRHYRQLMYYGLQSEGFDIETISDEEVYRERDQISSDLQALSNVSNLNEEQKINFKQLDQKLEEVNTRINYQTKTDKVLRDKFKESATARKDEHLDAVVNINLITTKEAEVLREKKNRTAVENLQVEKYNVYEIYGVEPKKELIKKHQNKIYSKYQLHFFLSQNINFVKLYDKRQVFGQIDGGEQIMPSDLKNLTLQVRALDTLNIKQWINRDPNLPLGKTDPELIAWCKQILLHLKEIHKIFDKDFSKYLPNPESEEEVKNPIGLLNDVLGLLDLGYKRFKRVQLGEERQWLYVMDEEKLSDERIEVFSKWKEKWADRWDEYSIHSQLFLEAKCIDLIPCHTDSYTNKENPVGDAKVGDVKVAVDYCPSLLPVYDASSWGVREPKAPTELRNTPYTSFTPSEANCSDSLELATSVEMQDDLSGWMTQECLEDIAQHLEMVATSDSSETVDEESKPLVMLKGVRACMPPEALKAAANLLPKPLRNRIAEMVRALNPPLETKPTSELKPVVVTPHLPQVTKTDKLPAPALSKEEEAFAEWSQLHKLIEVANEFLMPIAKSIPEQAIEKIKHLLTFIPSKAVGLAAELLSGSPRDILKPLLLTFDIAID